MENCFIVRKHSKCYTILICISNCETTLAVRTIFLSVQNVLKFCLMLQVIGVKREFQCTFVLRQPERIRVENGLSLLIKKFYVRLEEI